MFATLLESHSRAGVPRWGFAVALMLHATVLAALLRPSARAVAAIVVLPPDSFPVEERAHPPQPGPVLQLPGVPGPVIPTLPSPGPFPGVPQVPLPTVGAPGSLVSWVHDSSGVPPGDPWPLSMVQEPPVLLAAPLPVYPDRLRKAGIQGRVIVEAIVDTLGRVESGSVRVVHSDFPGFDVPATGSIRAALFRPARVFGRGVRVLVRVPVAFRLR